MPVAGRESGLLCDEQRICRKAESFFEGILTQWGITIDDGHFGGTI